MQFIYIKWIFETFIFYVFSKTHKKRHVEHILVRLVYFVLSIDILNMIFGFCVLFCIYEVEECFLFWINVPKYEELLYGIFSGFVGGFLVLNGPLECVTEFRNAYVAKAPKICNFGKVSNKHFDVFGICCKLRACSVSAAASDWKFDAGSSIFKLKVAGVIRGCQNLRVWNLF